MDDVKTGSHINRYEILESVRRSELIGIYKAYDTKLERNVFLKTILHSADYSPEAVEYFLTESRSLAKMSHPNIAKVLDFGQEDGNLFLVSEYVPGTPLSELMTRPMPWQEAAQILLPLTEALAYAHSKNIIHRDLKPDNITINAENQPILSDFSLMRIIEEEETRDMTGTNVGLGSASYISPEQGKGLTVDFRSDIYSLGVIFFEMVTGRKLFYASNSMEIVIQHVMADPPKPRSIVPGLPRSIEEIILNALSKERDKRYQTMQDFADALRAVVEGIKAEKKPRPFLGSTRMMIGASAIGLIVIAIATMFMLGLPPFGGGSASESTPESASTSKPVSTPTTIPASPTPREVSTQPVRPTATQPDPSAGITLPSIPVLPGANLPASSAVIDAGNVQSLKELARWGIPDIREVELINDNKILLAATSAGVYYFNAEDLSYLHFFDTEGSLTALAVSDNEEWVVTGDNKGTVAVWDIKNGKPLYRLEGTARGIKLLEISPDNSKVVFTDTDNVIHLWYPTQNNLNFLFEKRHLLNINSLVFTSDSDFVISGGDDFQIYIWDVPTGKALNNIPASQKVIDMDLSSDDERLAISLNNANATIQIWDWQAEQLVNTITATGILTPFTYITFSPNNQNVISGSADGIVRVWNAFGTENVWETPAKEGTDPSPIKNASVSDDGTTIAILYENGLLDIWGLIRHTLDISASFGYGEIDRLVISPNDKLLAAQNDKSVVEILSITDGTRQARISGTLPRGNPISPDSQMIAVKSGDLVLHSLSSNAVSLFTLYDFPVNGSVDYLPGTDIIAAADRQFLKYWSTSSGYELTPSLRRTEGRCVKFFKSDDSFLAAGSEIGVIASEDNLTDFCQIQRGARTTSEEYLSDGSIIVLSSENQMVQVWNLPTGNSMKELDFAARGSVLDAAISPDGKLLAAVSSNGSIEIFSLETYERLVTLDLKTGPVNQITFSHNGKFIITGSADGTIRFFGLNP